MAESSESKPSEKLPEGSKAVPPKSKGNNKTLIIVLVIVGALILLPGLLIGGGIFWLSRGDNAQNLTEDIIESSTGANVDINKDGTSVNIETEDGSVNIGGEQKIPEDLPTAVVLYDNQEVVGVITSTQDGTKYWNISTTSTDEVAKVSSFIETRFAENGWTTVSTSTYNGIVNYSFEKENLTAFITISPETEGGGVNISYSIQEEATAPQ
jgi:hypothetical protein